MIRIDVSDNIKEVTKQLDDLARKQVPFATARALTATGRDVRQGLTNTMGSVFASPTSFVMRSPFSTVATKAKPEVTVGIKDQGNGRASPADYLKEHFSGGARGFKPMELAMQSIGALPGGWRAIPAAGMKLDRNGNPNRNQVREVLGALKSAMRVHSGKGKRAQTITLFVRPVNGAPKRIEHLAPGIWQRTNTASGAKLEPVFLFVRGADYQKVIDLPKLTAEIVQAKFAGHFDTAMQDALRTAR